MYSVSSKFYNESVSDSPVAHIKIDIYNKSNVLQLTLEDGDIQDCTIKRSVGDSGKLAFGSCESAQCDMTILDESLEALAIDLREAVFRVYMGYEVVSSTTTVTDEDGDTYTEEKYSTEYIPMGIFFASHDGISDDYLMTTVTAYDSLNSADVKFNPKTHLGSNYYKIGAPKVNNYTWDEIKSTYGSSYLTSLVDTSNMVYVSAENIASSACSTLGITYSDTNDNGYNWPGSVDHLYAARPNGTVREVLQQLGTLTCTNCIVNNDGRLNFHRPYSTGLKIRPEQYGAGGFTFDKDYASRLVAIGVTINGEYDFSYTWNGKKRKSTYTLGTDESPYTRSVPYGGSGNLSSPGSYAINIDDPAWFSDERININYTITAPNKKTKKVDGKKKSTVTTKNGIGIISALNQDIEGRKYDVDGDGTVDNEGNEGFLASHFVENLVNWPSDSSYYAYSYHGFSCDLNGLPQLQPMDGVYIADPMSFTTDSDGEPVTDGDGNIVYNTWHLCLILEQEITFDGSISQKISATSADYDGETLSSSDGSTSSDDDDSDGTDNQTASNEATIDDIQDDLANALMDVEVSTSSDTPTYLVTGVTKSTNSDGNKTVRITRVSAESFVPSSGSVDVSYSNGILTITKKTTTS